MVSTSSPLSNNYSLIKDTRLPSLATTLPHELLVKIFYNLEHRPQHRHSSTSSISFSSSLSLERTDILSCAMVCQDWYYAAVDTLWREVDLQNVESFVQFSCALDSNFSYMDKQPRTILVGAAAEGLNSSAAVDGGENISSRRTATVHRYGTDTKQHKSQRKEAAIIEGQERSLMTCTSYHQPTALSSILPSPSPSVSSSVSSTRGPRVTTSVTTSWPYNLSLLQCPPLSGQVGYAGKGYIRSLSLAGTSDCRAPRPFPYLPSCITDRHLVAISSALTHLTSLSLCHCTALTDMAVIQLITSSSPYLRRIDLTECRLITNLTVQVIAQLCGRQLEDLSLKGCGLVSDDAIMELAHHCTRLQSVNIGQCTRVGDRGLQALLKSSGRTWRPDPVLSGMTTKNASLSKLGIAGCYGITINGLLMISEQLSSHDESTGEVSSSLVSLEFTCPTLKTAQRTALTEQPAYSRPSSQAMRFFQTLPSTLEEITICDAHTLSQDDIICLVDKVGSSLRTLRLDNANSVDSETLTHVLAVCPHLTVLCIPRATRLDDAGVIELAKAKCATSLLELDLSACHALTDVCLIRLATAKTSSSYDSHLSPSSLSYLGTSKGKERAFVDAGPSPPCLFSNLRRLDLSYNDKLTLTGIIPLVMSLKNLCALDVSFCGDGVTRSWKLSLESIRPILTSAGAVSSCSSSPSSAGSSTVSDRDDSQEGSLSESCNSISEDDDEESMYPMMNSRPERIQPQQMPPPQTSECATSNQSMLSIQNLQQLVSGFIPLPTIASRRGLGRYVGPLLNRSTTPPAVVTAASHDNVVNPRHPPQYAEQGQEAASSERKHQGRQDQQQQQHARRRSSASSTSSCSSMTSTISSSSPSPSASASSPSSPVTISPPSPSSFFLNPLFSKKEHQKQQQNDLSHNQCRRSSSSSCSSSSSSSSFKPKSKIKTKIKLSDRFDVLETTPRRVGMPAGFYLGSWFTPQHHYQLQELHQIQTQRHQEAQDAAALNMAAGELGEGIGGVGAAAALADQPTAVPSLPIEMMHHPVIATPRAGVAIMGSGTGAGDQQTMPDTDMLELNETLSRDMTLISASVPPLAGGMGGAGVAGGVGQPEVSFRQRQQHLYILYMQRLRGQRRADGVVGGTAATGRGVNSGAAAGSTVMGHCEISAWGLSRLKEEWSLT